MCVVRLSARRQPRSLKIPRGLEVRTRRVRLLASRVRPVARRECYVVGVRSNRSTCPMSSEQVTAKMRPPCK